MTVWDTNALIHRFGENHARDFRGLYAYDIPFTNDFFMEVGREWAALVRAKAGRLKKCIILDLDNTLWGGIVGELGPKGIAVGPDYPGLAFQNFQHALLDYFDRGVILAINSRNNPADVAEVFEKNPHMILQEKHFASAQINWNDKASNISTIAADLNIGLESIVFLDDDPVNRDLVRTVHPSVSVPELPTEPELYVNFLHQLDYFHQFSITDEDREKGRMYAEERRRKETRSQYSDISEYIATLGIEIRISVNATAEIPRIAQLTQKTNQFNLTTKRYLEHDVQKLINDGALVVSGEVSDKFGKYGVTMLAIIIPGESMVANIDTFLMSCRVMGRGVEYAFMRSLAGLLSARSYTQATAEFRETKKNVPAKEFLPGAGFVQISRKPNVVRYAAQISDILKLTQDRSVIIKTILLSNYDKS